MAVLGIDFGTTTTVAATCGGRAADEIDFLKIDGDQVLMPSIVWYAPDRSVRVGAQARERRLVDPGNVFYAVKRILGRPWMSSEVLEFRNQYPFELRRGPDDRPRFSSRAGELSPAQVCTEIFRTVAKALPSGQRPTRTCISVPAAARPDQQDATRAAAAAAGLPNVVLLSEPNAAAYAYLSRTREAKTIAVYDLGGGTLDLAILRWDGSAFETLALGGDSFLGGDDVTRRLATWVADEILESRHWDVRANPESYELLVVMCEAAKLTLSVKDEVTLPLGDIDPVLGGQSLRITRAKVESLCADLVRRTFILCDELAARATVSPRQLDDVILVGGGSYMPVIRSGVQHYFGRSPRMSLLPDRAVAMGAALYAATL